MTPYYEDDHVTLYHGDSRELLPEVAKGTLVDTVVTDPPYGIGLEYGADADDWRPDREFWRAIHRLLPPWGSLHMTVSNKHLPYWIDEVREGGFAYMHTSVYWNRTRAGGNWGGQFAYAWEPWLSFHVEPTELRTHPWKLDSRMMSDVFAHDGRRDTDHPAERDLATWRLFMDYLPGQIFLDPFAGVGTTLHAARLDGRFAIGIEKEERWCEQAALRLSQMTLV